jgi:hypothetical protein
MLGISLTTDGVTLESLIPNHARRQAAGESVYHKFNEGTSSGVCEKLRGLAKIAG